MGPISAVVQSLVLQMGPTTAGPFCNLVQSQTPQICFTGTGSGNLGSRRIEPPMVGPRCLRLPTSLTTQPGSVQCDGPGLSQNDHDCTRMGQHALALGSSQIPFALPVQPDLVMQPSNGQPHRDLKNLNLHAWLLEPPLFRNKGSLTKWQQELRLLKDHQQVEYQQG